MCKVVVLRNKPIAFLTFSLPSLSSLLKLLALAILWSFDVIADVGISLDSQDSL